MLRVIGGESVCENHGFSADGKMHYLTSNREGIDEYDLAVYRYNPSSGLVETLTQGQRRDVPQWEEFASESPDGKLVAWNSSHGRGDGSYVPERGKWQAGLRTNLWLANKDGTERRQVTDFPNAICADFAFAADSRSVILTVAGRNENLYRVNIA